MKLTLIHDDGEVEADTTDEVYVTPTHLYWRTAGNGDACRLTDLVLAHLEAEASGEGE